MKTAICYYSRHHGNTRKVLDAMAGEGGVGLIDVTAQQAVRLEEYDCIGFASGVYFGKFHDGVLSFARKYLPHGKACVFRLHLWRRQRDQHEALLEIAKEKNCPILGKFGCKGFDTFGPFKLVGGIAKGHPNTQDLERARSFYREIKERLH